MKAVRTSAIAVAIALSMPFSGAHARASQGWIYRVLYNFNAIRGAEGGRAVLDAAGNIYTVALEGGPSNNGSVLELSPPAAGRTTWTWTVIHRFAGYPADGANPTEVTFDAAGNLYGTTSMGGSFNQGVVFKLSPPAPGHAAWKETVLLDFHVRKGAHPAANDGLTFDAAGNLYSTTNLGGTGHCGTVFQLSPPVDDRGRWKQTVLHDFSCNDGYIPDAYVVFDSAGNLYSTTAYGGAHGAGAVFRLSPPAPGGDIWQETLLYSSTLAQGYHPNAGVVLDAAGNLYGTAAWGASHGYGGVFELSPPAAGETAWTYRTLYNFQGTDGAYPFGGVILDAAGNLYGETTQGGSANQGTVFELSPPEAGQTAWTETILHSFTGVDGSSASVDLTFDGAGNLYGSAPAGGTRGSGVMFELSR